MQTEIQSYNFPLADNCDSSYITSLKSGHFVVGAAAGKSSYLHLFKYEEDNPKKSTSQNKVVEGIIYDLVSAQNESRQMTLAVIKEGGQYKIQEVKTEAITSQGNDHIVEPLLVQQTKINSLYLRKDMASAYFAESNRIGLLDLEKKVSSEWLNTTGNITSMTVDPIHDCLTYTIDRQIVACDKKSNTEKFRIRAGQGITNIDYNPNKQYCLLSSHHEAIKFWDIRKGNLPIKTYDDHPNLLVQAAYNHSHDQLIACAYDDGSVSLLRLTSVSSSPQNEIEDAVVKLYDEHEDSVYGVVWSSFSPWVFVSLTYNASSLVINLVPSVEKYRILL